MLLLGLGCCLLAASRLNGQGSGSRAGGAPPREQSAAEQVQDLMRGGTIPQPQIDSAPAPLIINPKDIQFPTPKIEFSPPADHSGEIGAIFSITTPLGILIAIIAMGLARRRQEQAAHEENLP
jgi:hypothetical protein